LTTSEEEGKEAAVKVLKQGVSMILPVGGDGTLASMVNFLCDSIRKNDPTLTTEAAFQKLPLIGYIPMGTGNGVGSVVGADLVASSSPLKIFRRKQHRRRKIQRIMKSFYDIGQKMKEDAGYLSSDAAPDVIELPMMEVSYPDSKVHDDSLCFFAGVGFDSLMLQDFQSIKKWAIRTKILTKTLSSVVGYCVALVVKTLPKCVMRNEHNIEVLLSTRDPDTLWIDHRRGDVVQKVGPTDDSNQALLYKGTSGILAAGTSPFYGGGLRLFPFARITTDKMHLRLGRIHPLRGFFNIPKIFEGSYRDKRSASFGCMDFIGDDFDIQITSSTDSETKGFPVQHSGESVGYFERFRLRVVKEPVRFVTLMKKRIVSEDSCS
jgi:diacylglycerol kinase family enzyme